MKEILRTERLLLREMTEKDEPALREILMDQDVMYAYGHAFSEEEVHAWLVRQQGRYRDDGFGLWAMVRLDNGKMIGQCGITMQPIGERRMPEVGYLLRKDHWHMGYAPEAAVACRDYAFANLGIREICSIIRNNNMPSRRVAVRNGMTITGCFTKFYHGEYMPHLIYSVSRKDD